MRDRLKRMFFSAAWAKLLLWMFVAWFVIWAIRPSHPADFLLEHLLTVAFVAVLWWSYRRFRLSNISYTLMFLFMCLHVVGAHYTYSEVPYIDWGRSLTAVFGGGPSDADEVVATRNHYDRFVHFTFGLLMAYPVREIFVRLARVKGFWGYYLPLDVTMSLSMIYELLEWGIAVVVAGEVGQSYLGTQGDVWDAHKDMALATIGACVAMSTTAGINWWCQHDFAQEWAASLSSPDPVPLGEVRLAEMLSDEPQKNQRADRG
jgi:putative membrane protein